MDLTTGSGAIRPSVANSQQAPDVALAQLLEGNRRFASGQLERPNQDPARRAALTKDQRPLAAIISCVDPRVVPELIFDQGFGDLFVLRMAGNIITPEIIASIEFAIEVFKIPLIMVLGHQYCGAMSTTIESLRTNVPAAGHMGVLVDALAPAVKDAAKGVPLSQFPASETPNLLDRAVRSNVVLGLNEVKSAQPIVSDAIELGKVSIVGMYYNLETGIVDRIV